MRRVMSVGELKRYYEGRSVRRILFCTENQSWDKVEHTAKVKLTFTIMLIAFNPNAICLKNKDDFLRLDRVKSIKMSDEKSMLGAVFTIICGDLGNNSNDVAYTIIAR